MIRGHPMVSLIASNHGVRAPTGTPGTLEGTV